MRRMMILILILQLLGSAFTEAYLSPTDDFADNPLESLQEGILYPRESVSREVRSLDGVWDFRISPQTDQKIGFTQHWYSQSLKETGETIPMPVPSSFNDVTQNKTIRDFIGWVWYDRHFYIPERWRDQRIVLRFGSAHYNTIVWVNGVQAVQHSGGHLPFQAEIASLVRSAGRNLITVALNNTLTPETIPQGAIHQMDDKERYPPGYFEQTYNFDFFNYAGIHRPVFLYTTPMTYIDDITVHTDLSNDLTTGFISYNISTLCASKNSASKTFIIVKVLDEYGVVVATSSSSSHSGTVTLKDVKLWWPYLMHDNPGYLYTLQVTSKRENVKDVYSLPIGIRRVDYTNTSFFINRRLFYFRGFGKHEDAYIRGKGVDFPLILKDFNLIRWTGANSFRTSHYPYAEEIMDQADRQGIVVIDESPAIGLTGFDKELLLKHMLVMAELIRRDKNRPSVVMWSLGNEPQSSQEAAGNYFRSVVQFTKFLDSSRPITTVLSQPFSTDRAAEHMDVICVNRYFAWYSDSGRLELIQRQTEYEFTQWHRKFNKSVLISEYGAGSVAGFHSAPSFIWTEEYQTDLMKENFVAFDSLKEQGFFVGEMIWNFADFAVPQEYFRPEYCLKGVFTRERLPKAAAHLIRRRYWSLAAGCSVNVSLPEDLKKEQCQRPMN